MSDIICECGHGIDRHVESGCIVPIGYKDNGDAIYCDCRLSSQAIDARHQLKQMTAERDALAKQLRIAIKYISNHANCKNNNMRYPAEQAPAEIAALDSKKGEER
jgi:hypothetical protein